MLLSSTTTITLLLRHNLMGILRIPRQPLRAILNLNRRHRRLRGRLQVLLLLPLLLHL